MDMVSYGLRDVDRYEYFFFKKYSSLNNICQIFLTSYIIVNL